MRAKPSRMGLVPLQKKLQEALSPLPPREGTARRLSSVNQELGLMRP